MTQSAREDAVSHRFSFLLPAFVMALVTASPVRADNLDLEFLDYRLSCSSVPEDANSCQTLTFGPAITIKSFSIRLKKIGQIDDTFYIVGFANPGGNSCNSSPFVVSLKRGEAPKQFGPLDVCNQTTTTYLPDGVSFVEKALVGEKVRTWTWSPKTGLTRTEAVKAADTSKGWSTLWDRKLDHPSELYESVELTQAIQASVGANSKNFREQMSGIGSATFDGDILTARSCVKYECDQTGAFLALDLPTKKTYSAYKPRGKRIVVQPAVKEWPEAARRGLAEWAKEYK